MIYVDGEKMKALTVAWGSIEAYADAVFRQCQLEQSFNDWISPSRSAGEQVHKPRQVIGLGPIPDNVMGGLE